MSAPIVNEDALFAVLKPELEKLCKNSPRFGALTLRAEIHYGAVGNVSLGIETTCKIAKQSSR